MKFKLGGNREALEGIYQAHQVLISTNHGKAPQKGEDYIIYISEWRAIEWSDCIMKLHRHNFDENSAGQEAIELIDGIAKDRT